MIKKIRFTIVYTLLFTSISLAQPTDKLISQQVDSLINAAYEKGIFSGEVIISHNNEISCYKQLGYADWNTKRPIDKSTLFNIGSLNKQFTEEIIHQLVAENKLSYSDNLNKYLEIFPDEIGSKITVQQLLDMKAGLGDYLQDPKFDKIEFTDFSMAQLLDIIKTEPLLFEPGTNREYSNSGYVVLGAIIEKVTSLSYETNLRDRIAKPLRLENIFYTKAEKSKQKNRAYGTEIDFECNKTCFDNIANSTPAGGIYTDINTLLKFTEAKMKSNLPSGKKYGNGMVAGGTPLWNSTIYFNEKNGYAFVIMANTGNIADEVALRIKSIIKNEPYAPLELPFNITLYKIINEKGIEYVEDHAEELAEQAGLPYDERFLNFFGYQFLNGRKVDIAINLFKINIELFPTLANTYDSLAEAYLKSGDKKNALKYYKIELEMKPNNQHVKTLIADLEKEK